MSVLAQKLQEVRPKLYKAAKLHKVYQFQQSLKAYEDCITFCQQTDESNYVKQNILTVIASLHANNGNTDKALSILKDILKQNPYHYLARLRRCQVHKKINKFHKSRKDLEKISVFNPQNNQIAALKNELNNLCEQNADNDSSDDSQDIEDDEEDMLQFANLKKIDRSSKDLTASVKKLNQNRKSRVTILGDSTIQYASQYTQQDNVAEMKINPSQVLIRSFKQIQLQDQQQQQDITKARVKVKGIRNKKSILKNKNTSIFIAPVTKQSKKELYLRKQSKLSIMIKSIDGNLVKSAQNHEQSGKKQVQFRKSVNLHSNQMKIPLPITSSITINENKQNVLLQQPHILLTESKMSKGSRKSCLKRSSVNNENPISIISQSNKKPIRRSKFDDLNLIKIDGLIHKSNQQNQNKKQDLSDSDSQGSSHNIFGSTKINPKQLQKQLGFSLQQTNSGPVDKSQGKKSILKKSSEPRSSKKQQIQVVNTVTPKKVKKSVMFGSTM